MNVDISIHRCMIVYADVLRCILKDIRSEGPSSPPPVKTLNCLDGLDTVIMTATRNVTEDIVWLGGDDRSASIFEGMFPIPQGVSYNSYLIMDEKTILMDTVDASVESRFWDNLTGTLDGRTLDYLYIGHMEPDHGACLRRVIETYPCATVVASERALDMLYNFYGIRPEKTIAVKEGDTLCTGRHTLRFIAAVMVHWPEVMFAYDEYDGTLYSEDGFGTFGALGGRLFADECDFDAEYLDEARRYYANIVGKYGSNVQTVLQKASGLDIKRICPLHGPAWRKDLGHIIEKYDAWSSYRPEEKGVVIAYSSMYGNTEEAADLLAMKLRERGLKNLSVYNVTRTHPSYVVSDAFRYTNIVFASPTYNNAIHPTMTSVIEDMANMCVQGRRFSLIANGSWAPRAHKLMEDEIKARMKDMELVGEPFVIKSSMGPEQEKDLDALADAIMASL